MATSHHYWWKVICECVSTVWHAASLNTSTVKHTHAGITKQAFSDQSQCAAWIVAKVMFFDARRSWWSSTKWVRVQELLSINNSLCLVCRQNSKTGHQIFSFIYWHFHFLSIFQLFAWQTPKFFLGGGGGKYRPMFRNIFVENGTHV